MMVNVVFKECLNTDYLIRKLSREYRQNLREYGILCDYEYRFSFGKAIRHVVEWYNSDLCRRFRKTFYNGEKYFYLNYDNRRIPDLLFHGTAYELSWTLESMAYVSVEKIKKSI